MSNPDPDPRVDFDLDPEGPGEHDAHLLDESEPDLATCPECGAAVSAYTEICHRCGYTFEDAAWKARFNAGKLNLGATVVGLGVVLGLIAVLMWLGLS